MARWQEEDPNDYLSFHDGMVDAAITRVVDREYDAWSDFLFWRTAYFSLMAWSSIYLMRAPTATTEAAELEATLLPSGLELSRAEAKGERKR